MLLNQKRCFYKWRTKISNTYLGYFCKKLCCQKVSKIAQYGSVTRLGSFWKFLVINFQRKVVQFNNNFLGYFEKPHSYEKTVVARYFLGNFWKHLGYFLIQHLVISHWASTTCLSILCAGETFDLERFWNVRNQIIPNEDTRKYTHE